MDLFVILLFLHILGAIVAFGPGFASMVVGPMVAGEPQYANFYARTQQATSRKIEMPVVTSMLITGAGLIVVRGWAAETGGRHWLEAGILLYVVLVVMSMVLVAPASRRLVALTSEAPTPGSAPAPELVATAARVRMLGMVMGLLTVLIVFLMVTKPF